MRDSISKNLDYFKELSPDKILEERKNKFLKIGRNDGFIRRTENLSSLTVRKNKFNEMLKSKKLIYLTAFIFFIMSILIITIF